MATEMSKVMANIAEYAAMVGCTYSQAAGNAYNGGYGDIIEAIKIKSRVMHHSKGTAAASVTKYILKYMAKAHV